MMSVCSHEKGTLSPKQLMISPSNYGDAERDFYSLLFYFSNLYKIYIYMNAQQNIKESSRTRKPSIIVALSILKQTEQKIQQTQKRVLVMQSHHERQLNKQKYIERRLKARSIVEKDIQQYKRRKDQYQQFINYQIGENKIRNQQQKQVTRERISAAKKRCIEGKNNIFMAGKKQKKVNQTIINENKEKQKEQNQQLRNIIIQQDVEGKKIIQKYNQNKRYTQIAQKQEERDKIISSISSKKKLLLELERNSQSRLTGNSQEKPRNFRVKVVSRGNTTIVY